MKPYYDHAGIIIYCGDCREVLPTLEPVDLVLTDPPYGIGYKSNSEINLPSEIQGDDSVSLRDWVLKETANIPALIFGSWKAPKPKNVRMVLIWDTGGALGMGALDLPWKPSHAEIYVIGHGFNGRRTSDVLRYSPIQAMASRGRIHPMQKPINLIKELLNKSPSGLVLDPFAGSGTTLRAAKDLCRRAIGIEIEEKYCEIAAKRLEQEVLQL